MKRFGSKLAHKITHVEAGHVRRVLAGDFDGFAIGRAANSDREAGTGIVAAPRAA